MPLSENKLVTCPYDEAHKVKESRLQLHIAKCKLNHLDLPKKVCPFNATHLLPVGEYDHHLISCPDRAPLDRQLTQSVHKNNPFKGRTDVPGFSDPVPLNDDEIWEVATHIVQLPPPPPGAVLEPGEFQKPAERKRFYQELHRLPGRAEGTSSIPSPVAAPAQAPSIKPPRQPTTHSKIQDNNKPSAHVIENLGLGRGKPASSRIAANFQTVEASENNRYSRVVSDMSNLGLGRGKPNNAAAFFNDDDDFPALGCGRGIVNKQNNVRLPGSKFTKPKN